MQKLLISSIAIAFTLGMPLAALANSYDNFMRKQVAEFENPNSKKCKEKSMKVAENGNEMTYDLCIYKGKPVFLRTSRDGDPMSLGTFKGGKLVQLLWAEQGSTGFRNGQPMVEWNSGEKRLNWKLTAEQKSNFLKMATQENLILRKFGF
jgi:hypothetical protein